MTMKIMRAQIDHLDVLVPLFDGYRQFYRQPSDPPAARKFLEDRLRQADSVILLAMVEDDSRDHACGFTQLYPSFSSVCMKRTWILNDMFVDPARRRSGIARALIEAAHRVAAETGAASVTLSTEVTNETAKRLYKATSYERVTAFESYSYKIASRSS